ncbi:hypothetical protein ABPG72_003776 [Tetrahymena utriculariae]
MLNNFSDVNSQLTSQLASKILIKQINKYITNLLSHNQIKIYNQLINQQNTNFDYKIQNNKTINQPCLPTPSLSSQTNFPQSFSSKLSFFTLFYLSLSFLIQKTIKQKRKQKQLQIKQIIVMFHTYVQNAYLRISYFKLFTKMHSTLIKVQKLKNLFQSLLAIKNQLNLLIIQAGIQLKKHFRVKLFIKPDIQVKNFKFEQLIIIPINQSIIQD